MSYALASLHKILKDETRRKILLLLNEKGNASYSDFMDSMGIVSTGTLNYHLKVLGDLLEKNESNHYILSEKGKLASRLLLEFPEPDYEFEVKKKWWRRFWAIGILLQSAGLVFMASLYLIGSISLIWLLRSVLGFVTGMLFLYFFYRMIRPPKNSKKEQTRTVKDVFVSGRTAQEVKEEIMRWINKEGISLESERDGFMRGRLGIPSGLGLTAPKYFEVSFKPEQNGVAVHTEGWVSLYDISERSFSNRVIVFGNIPRRKGWKVIGHLWKRLSALSEND